MIAGKIEFVRGKPPRKRYKISELGKIALRDKVQYTLSELTFTPSPVDLSLMILPTHKKKDACEFLKLHLTALQEKYAECTDAIAELSSTHSPSVISKHLELHSSLLAFRIKWTEELLSSVAKESKEERAAAAKWLKQEALLRKCMHCAPGHESDK
jgi:DNA-binding PadR family transcriptional regulator